MMIAHAAASSSEVSREHIRSRSKVQRLGHSGLTNAFSVKLTTPLTCPAARRELQVYEAAMCRWVRCSAWFGVPVYEKPGGSCKPTAHAARERPPGTELPTLRSFEPPLHFTAAPYRAA